jgi:hypothetical protein
VIEQLIQTNVADFNKDALKKLKPYFDVNIARCESAERELWFHNLLALARHNLGVAHCVQHNHYPRLHIEVKFENGGMPDFYDPVYENQIGCFSNFKVADSMKLDGYTVTGTKQWISLVDQANFGVFRVPVNDTEAYILINFASAKPIIDLSYTTPIGMTIARPGSITLDNFTIPESHILGYRKYHENSPKFFHVTNMSDYCFVTNYLGVVVELYEDLKRYIEKTNVNVDFEFRKLGLAVSGLVMLWQDNLPSVHTIVPTDEFWHRRNTQYTLSKDTLVDIISLILKIGDSRWLDAKSPDNQRFRDALTFSSHMKPLYRNLEEKHFVKY